MRQNIAQTTDGGKEILAAASLFAELTDTPSERKTDADGGVDRQTVIVCRT